MAMGYIYLLIKPGGARWWRLDYSIHGKRKTLSVGVYPDTGLKAARANDDQARQLIAAGIDPSDLRKGDKEKIAQETEADKRIKAGLPPIDSFTEAANELLTKKKPAWAESQYIKLKRRLDNDILPSIGAIQI